MRECIEENDDIKSMKKLNWRLREKFGVDFEIEDMRELSDVGPWRAFQSGDCNKDAISRVTSDMDFRIIWKSVADLALRAATLAT